MKKKIPVLISMFLLLNYCLKSQTVQFGKMSDDPKEKNYGVLGVVGDSYYTLSANLEGKGSVCFIHKCSSETMEIQETKKIELDGLDMLKKSWSVLKVDKKLVLIIADWSRETANKIYGEVLVNENGSINTWDRMDIIGELENPEEDGKKIIMGTNILITGSPEVEGLPTANNKILVYYQKNKDWSMKEYDFKTDMLSFVLFDKDLKQIDKQNTNFDNAQIPLNDPIIDVEGNFYLLPRTNQLNRAVNANVNQLSSFVYSVKDKKITKQKLPFDSFKNDEKALSISTSRINEKGNLVYVGFYNAGGKTDYGSTSDGLYVSEMNVNGIVKFDCLLLDEKIFDQTHELKNKKAEKIIGHVSVFLTTSYFVVSMKREGLDKKGVVVSMESNDFTILKMGEDGKLKKVNSYTSNIYFKLSTQSLRPLKPEIGPLNPIFVEKKDKLYLMFSLWNYEYKSLNLKDAGERICALNTFDLKGDLQTTFLYDIIGKVTHSEPREINMLKNGDCLISSDFIRSDVVKVSFK